MLTICQKNWFYERLRRPDTTFRDASWEAASMVKTKKVLIGKKTCLKIHDCLFCYDYQ